MTDTTDQQAVTVAQIDIDAASSIAGTLEIEDWATGGGYFSGHLVQAFARHRLASVSSASAETLALQAIKAVTATAKDGAAGLSRIMAITNAAGVQASYSELLQDPAVALIVDRPRTEWAHLFKPDATGCAIPPEGWQCSRARGHTGPCAASPEPVPATNQAGEVFKTCADIADAFARGQQQMIDEEGPDEACRGGKEVAEFIANAIRRRAALATQPATSQEGEDEDAIHDCGNLGWCQAPGCCSRHGTAATPTPPTLSEDLRALVEALEPFSAACNITTAEDSESLYDSLAAEKLTWRDLRRARAALAQVKVL